MDVYTDIFFRTLFSCLIGVFLGAGLNFAICSSKGKAKQAIFWGSGGSIISVIGVQATQIIEMKIEYTHVVLLLSAIVTCGFLLNRFINTLREKCPELPIDISYLLSTDSQLSSLYDSYIESQKTSNLKELEFKKKEKELALLEESLNKKEKELTSRKSKIKSSEQDIKEQIKSGYLIDIPHQKQVALSESLFSSLPKYFEHMIRFLNSAGSQFELLRDNSDSQAELPKEILIKADLSVLAATIRRDLIQDTSVRVIFRAFNGTEFEAVAVDSRGGHDKHVSNIPVSSNSMITRVGKHKRSLVKSINPEYDLCVNESSERWNDYITFPFEQYIDQNIPLLTMNISVRNPDRDLTNFLKFLSLIRFEIVIDEFLEVINEEHDLKTYLTKYRNKDAA